MFYQVRVLLCDRREPFAIREALLPFARSLLRLARVRCMFTRVGCTSWRAVLLPIPVPAPNITALLGKVLAV